MTAKIKRGVRRAALALGAAAALAGGPGCDGDLPPEPAWFYITAEQGDLPSNDVYGIYAEQDGSWFATYAGLAYNRGTEWKVYSYANGMPADEIFGVAVCPNGDVWAATWLGAARLRGEQITTFTTENGLPSDFIFNVVYDGAKLWLATERGLARFNDPGFTVIRGSTGLPGDDVRDVYAVGPDQVWVACIGGAAFYDRGKITEYTTVKTGLPSSNVYAVAARGEEAWIGTDEGLSLLREGKLVRTYTVANSNLKSNIINDLAFRPGGELWVATAGGGASRSVGEGFETFEGGHGPLSDYILAIYCNKLGYVWLGTLRGGVNRYYD
jgi:ligand-binding sensor domain-containing protein